jgi:hypothetical protein
MPKWIIGMALLAVLVVQHSDARSIFGGRGVVGPAAAVSDEEFVGPFASWNCARSSASGTCGLAGSGSGSAYFNAPVDGTDATSAVQACISAMTTAHPVCYFPAGAYKISTTLTYNSISGCSTNCAGYNLIGHDPSDTSLVWAGSSGGTLLYLNGVGLSEVSRFTFNGGGLAGILIDQSIVSGGGDTGNLFVDDVFTNGLAGNAIGYRCGFFGFQCSETGIVRATFNNLFDGATTCNANAVGVWVWYSTFNSNNYALGGQCQGTSAGQVNSIHNIFNGSSVADFYGATRHPETLIDNYSTGSNQFVNGGGFFLLQRNTILNPTTNPPILNIVDTSAFDNVIKMGAGTPIGSNGGGRVFSMGNTTTASSMYNLVQLPYSFSDTVNATIGTIVPPAMPGTPPNNSRTIYEASSGGTNNSTCSVASPCTAQAAICMAATGSNGFSAGNCTGTVNSSKNVAHIQAGNYTIASTLSIPANSNMQLIGDSWRSSNLQGSAGVTPVLQVNGPSHVTLREFLVAPNSNAQDGILFSGADFAGSKIWMEFPFSENSVTAAFMDNVSQTSVESHMFNFPFSSGTTVVQNGGTFNVFFGESGNDVQQALISGSANYQEVGIWQDAHLATGWAAISGSGTYTSASNLLSTSNTALDNPYVYNLSSYSGNAVLVGSRMLPWDCTHTSAIGGSLSSGRAAAALQEQLGGDDSYVSFTGTTSQVFGNLGYTTSGCTVNLGTDTVNGSPHAPDGTFLNAVMPASGTFRATAPSLPQAGEIQVYRVYVHLANNAYRITP